MEEFDVIVIGGGSGLIVSSAAAHHGLKTAIVEEGPLGGTCLNRGCIPSKMIIHSADVLETIKHAEEFGIKATVAEIDFKKIVERASSIVDKEAEDIEEGISESENLTLFKARAKFIGDKTLQVGDKTINGKKIIIAAGTRPSVPPIAGIAGIPYLTSDQALRLKTQPKKLTIIGGGYIGAELAHFFGSLGTEVTIVQRDQLLLPNIDKEIAEKFTEIFSKKHHVYTAHAVTQIRKKAGVIIITISPTSKGAPRDIESDQVLIATGRVPNTDLLNVRAAGVELGKSGFINVNEYMQTSVKNIWALGDIAGRFLFKHSANLEAQIIVKNAILGKKEKINYTAMPYAIFTSPQIAGVGEREQDLTARKADFVTGIHKYIRTGMGAALNDTDGFVKIYADKKTRKILGCHILGTDAPTLIHEVILAMRNDLTIDQIKETIHIHPALPEVVQRACANAR